MQSLEYQKLYPNLGGNGIPVMPKQFSYGLPYADNVGCACPCYDKCKCCINDWWKSLLLLSVHFVLEWLDASNYNNINPFLKAQNPLAYGQPSHNYNRDVSALLPILRSVENSRAAYGQELEKINMAQVRKAAEENSTKH